MTAVKAQKICLPDAIHRKVRRKNTIVLNYLKRRMISMLN